jgi:hypothetical protein
MTSNIVITKQNLSEYASKVNFEQGYAFFFNPRTFYGSKDEFETYGEPSMCFVDRDLLNPAYRKAQDDFSLSNAGYTMPHLLARDGRAKFKRFEALRHNKPIILTNHTVKESDMSPDDYAKYQKFMARMNGFEPGLTHADDPSVTSLIAEAFDGAYTVSNFIPQQSVIPKGVEPVIGSLYDLCVNIMLVLQQKGISANEVVDVGGNMYGQLFVGAVILFIDLFYAMDNRLTFLARMPKWYWKLRSTLMNITVDNISYYWDLTAIGEITDYLNSLPMGLSTNPAVSIAPIDYSAGLTPDGQFILATSFPVINVDDMIAAGSEFMAQLMQQNGAVTLFTFDAVKPIRTAAAFAQKRPFSTSAYPTVCNLISEVSVKSKDYKYASIGLASAAQQRAGKFTYTIVDGPAQLMFEVHENRSYGFLNVVPVPVALTDILAHLCTFIIARDIYQNGNNVVGSYVQSLTSMALAFGPGQFLQYISYIIARYRLANTVLITTLLPQPFMQYVPPGSKTWFPTDDVAVNFPQTLIESLSKLCPIIRPIKRGYDGKEAGHELRIPFLYMNGQKTYANPLDNGPSSPSNSLLSLFKVLFPNATCSAFNFGSVGGFPNTLDISFLGPECFFYGPGCTNAKNAVSDAFSVAGQNMTMYPSQANIDEIGETLAYYVNIVCKPDRSDLTFDCIVTSDRKFVANTFAFDPNEIDNISRMLPTIYISQLDTDTSLETLLPYLTMTNTTVSMKAYDKQFNLLKSTLSAAHNIYFMGGNEQAVSDNARIVQHIGGGFISSAISKIASSLPHIGRSVGVLVSKAIKNSQKKRKGQGGKNGNVKSGKVFKTELHFFPDFDKLKSPDTIGDLGPYHPILRLKPATAHDTRIIGSKQIRVIT